MKTRNNTGIVDTTHRHTNTHQHTLAETHTHIDAVQGGEDP